MASSERFQGTVVWFNSKRGYGFLKPDQGDVDLFIHYSNIVAPEGTFKTLDAGQKVEYSLGQNHKGQQAIDIKLV